MLAFLKDTLRRQTGPRPDGPLTLPSALLNSPRSSSKVASAAAGLAETTRSRSLEDSEIHELNTSLSLRRTSVRVTALPALRDTERPRRSVSCFFETASTENSPPL